MGKRFGRVRLIARDDPRYQAYLEQFRLAREYQRAMRPPSPRQVFGEQVEELLRSWLGQTRRLSERRYLEYEEIRGQQAVLKYRELDAVEIPDPTTVHVFEIKASLSLGHGLRQLREDRALLSFLFPRVAATLLFVDTGMLPEERQAALEREKDVVILEELTHLAGYGREIGLHWVPLEQVIALAGGEENLNLEWLREGEKQEPPPPPEPQVWSVGGEEEELGPLGQALLRALGRPPPTG